MVQVACPFDSTVVQDLPVSEPIAPLLSLNRPNVAPTTGAPVSSSLTILTVPGWRGSPIVTVVVWPSATLTCVSGAGSKPAGTAVSCNQKVPAGRMLLMGQGGCGGVGVCHR